MQAFKPAIKILMTSQAREGERGVLSASASATPPSCCLLITTLALTVILRSAFVRGSSLPAYQSSTALASNPKAFGLFSISTPLRIGDSERNEKKWSVATTDAAGVNEHGQGRSVLWLSRPW